jgi:hypothetical protein
MLHFDDILTKHKAKLAAITLVSVSHCGALVIFKFLF